MDAETYSNVVLPIRSKARKAYDQAIAAKAPTAVLKALLAAKTSAESWAERVNPYRDESSADTSDSDTDTGAHAEVEAIPPKVRKPAVTVVNAR